MHRGLVGSVLGALVAGTPTTLHAQPATITTLDSRGDVGRDSAIAYGPDGLALISYQDTTNGDLKVALCQNAACTSALIRTVDDSGTVSGHTSIAVDADGRALIAYQAGPVVKLARCGDAVCSSATLSTVDALAAPRPGTAIGIGADGLAVVAYGDAANNRLKVAHCEDSTCSTSTITPYANRGSYNPSLTIAGDGFVLFAFDTFHSVHVGHCSDTACTAATFASILGDPTPLIGFRSYSNASLATGPDGRGVLALTLEETSIEGVPRFRTQVRRCQSVACSSVSFQGDVADEFASPAIDLLPGDRPLVAHYGGEVFPQRLQVTRCAVAACGTPGPVPPTYPIDAPGIGLVPDLAVGPDGVGLMSYYDGVNGDLKVAYLMGPELVVSDTTVVEGNAGLTTATFEVALSQATSATVQYGTASNTANSLTDYVPTSGTLTFAPGSLTQTVTVGVRTDLTPENLESFFLVLSNAQGASIVDDRGQGFIVDDDVASSIASSIELGHGSVHIDELAALPGPVAAVDHFRLAQDPFASYEVLADDLSGDVVPLDLTLLSSSGTTTVHPSAPVGTGSARRMAWQNTATSAVLNEVVRVSGGCATFCGPDDVYRLRVYETTLRGARFNNAGSQTTVLILQNLEDVQVQATVRFWSPTGELLATYDTALPTGTPIPPHGLRVLATAQVPGADAKSGSITVTHDAPYGRLAGKTVALEPATGFSFDTPLEPRRR